MIDLSTVKRIHFIGIGGVSTSAIAQILAKRGFEVSGSDKSHSAYTKHLEAIGIQVFLGHQAEQVDGADLIVYTAAVHDSNPEMVRANERAIPCLSRAEMLGQLMLDYENSICIAGTHGKTTSTSMTTKILNTPSLDPTALVGGLLEDLNSNVIIGESSIFLTEACEYTDSFLSFFPKIGVILNVDEDHLDYFKNLDNIIQSFVAFTQNIKDDGVLIINGDDYNSKKILPYYKGRTRTFGISDSCDVVAHGITYDDFGLSTFSVSVKGERIGTFNLNVPGSHNIYNALASICVALEIGVEVKDIATRLEAFKNSHRRFEKIGMFNGATVVDDYAHHPTAIKATLEAASKIQSVTRTRVIYQPHTYTRTKEHLHEFSSAFHQADEVILCDIYPSREEDIYNIHSKDLLELIRAEGISAKYYDNFDDIVAYIRETAAAGELIFTMGAGSVTQIAPQLVAAE